MRPSLIVLSLPSLAILACQTEQQQLDSYREYLPELEISRDAIDFGEVIYGENRTVEFRITNTGDLDMGLLSVELNPDGFEDNFTVAWDGTVLCKDDEGGGDGGDGGAEADTGQGGDGGDGGDGGTDSGDGGDGGDGGTDGESGNENVVKIPSGCWTNASATFTPVDVGTLWGSLTVTTVRDPKAEDADDAKYFEDPDEYKKTILMNGYTFKGEGNIVVTPRSLNMGHFWTGETTVEYVFVKNVGDGDIEVGLPYLSETNCAEEFTLNTDQYTAIDGATGWGMLPAGTSTLFEVGFAPGIDVEKRVCDIYVPTQDPDAGEVKVAVSGNDGDDPENEPPRVVIVRPEVGHVLTTADPFEVEIDMYDLNQPANTLICKIKGAVKLEASVTSCTPPTESGHVIVDVDPTIFDDGTETLLVTVTDQSEYRAYASSTIMWRSTFPESDDDGDGWGNDSDPSDCDDTDPTVYPAAAELYDGKDNDCDGGIDEDTLGFDDDGDSVSELEGDCDDRDPDTYPGAPEIADQKDNDCDGIVDEGTSRYDDDGDGFSEIDNDCDDTDASINPAAVEECDGIDNNCNGLKDQQEGCIATESEPYIIGGIRMAKTALGPNETTTMTTFVYDADGQDILYNWQEDTDLTEAGHTAIDNPTVQTIQWRSPKIDEDSPGKIYSVYVVVQDEDANQDWAFDEITVYPEPVALYLERILPAPANAGCGGDATEGFGGGRGVETVTPESAQAEANKAALLPILPLFGAFLLSRRHRRREDDTE